MCSPCSMVCPDVREMSALFSGVSRIWRCVRLVCWYDLNIAEFSPSLLVSGMLWCVVLVFGCVQNVSVSLPCFPVCP